MNHSSELAENDPCQGCVGEETEAVNDKMQQIIILVSILSLLEYLTFHFYNYKKSEPCFTKLF